MNWTAKILLACSGVILSGSTGFVYTTAQRVTALEAHRVDDAARLDRIEAKIDKLLERK